jgi:hypothetical protein
MTLNIPTLLARFQERILEQMTKEDTAQREAERAILGAELAAAEERAAAEIAALTPQRDKASAALAKAKAAYDAALATFAALEGTLANVKHQRNHRRNVLERQLCALADTRIDDARQRMEHRLDGLRRRGFTVEDGEMTGRFDPGTLRPIRERLSNEAAFRRIVLAVRDARTAFDALKRRHVENIEQAIEQIEDTIPWADFDTLQVIGHGATVPWGTE